VTTAVREALVAALVRALVTEIRRENGQAPAPHTTDDRRQRPAA
jgi:hypothetical protein